MKSLLTTSVSLLTASAAVLVANSAQAITFTVEGYQCPTATCVDLLAGGYNVTDGGKVVTGVDGEMSTNQHKTPGTDNNQIPNTKTWNTPGKTFDNVNDSTKVKSYNATSPSTNKIVVTELNNAFEFFWGSVDSFNKIEFFNSSNTLVRSFTGADIANRVGFTEGTTLKITDKKNGTGLYNFDAYVKFAGEFAGEFTKAELTSSRIAFEVAAKKVPEANGISTLLVIGAMAGSFALKNRFQQA